MNNNFKSTIAENVDCNKIVEHQTLKNNQEQGQYAILMR